MKIVVIGDVHGRKEWKNILLQQPDADRYIFIGDYFDSFQIKLEDQINNFLDIIAFKEANMEKVVLLIGNHDYHYVIGDCGISGFQNIGQYQIAPLMKKYEELFKIAHTEKNLLFTHAGVGETFMDITFGKGGWTKDTIVELLNDLWKYKPLSFMFNGQQVHGDDMGQTPIWIRPLSLTKDSHKLRKSFIQIVGHTTYRQLYIDKKSTIGGRYFFVDTMETSREYLIWEDGEFSLGNSKNKLNENI